MKNSPLRTLILAASISTLVTPVFADSTKAANTTALNATGSWTNNTVPGAADIAIWDVTVTAPNNSALGGDLSWLGIRIGNVGGTRNTTNSAFLTISNAASANTLTIGASGIDMSNAFQSLQIQSRVTIGASQTWSVANANNVNNPMGFNNGEDLGFQALAASTPFSLGGNVVTTTGAGQITITSGYTLSNGTINVGNNFFVIQGGGSRLTTVNNDVTLNVASGSTLHFQGNSQAVVSNATINLNGGTLRTNNNTANTGSVTIGGNLVVNSASTLLKGNNFAGGGGTATGVTTTISANLSGSGALNVVNAGAAIPLLFSGNNSGYTGTITLGAAGSTAGRVTQLNTATAGSAAATWNVSANHTLSPNGVTVDLGTLTGAGTVTNAHASNPAAINVGAGNFTGSIANSTATMALTKVGTGTLTLSGFNSYTGDTNVNGGTLRVAPGVLTGTIVNVASSATYAAQTASSGFLDTNVNVADGGILLVRPELAGVQVTVPSVELGTATGAVLAIDTGILGNPTAAPLFASSFAPVAGSKVRILGSNIAPGTFPVVVYSGAIGDGGFAALSLELPFRVTGGLVDNPNSVDVNVTGTAKPVWQGGIDNNWDIDSVGDGSTGTANWLAVAGPNTYVQAPVGTDSVVFDDTATGLTNVNLTTVLSPGGIAVNNAVKDYVFSGSGRISGGGALVKTGLKTLTVANAGVNDYSGGTFIDDGTVQVGDGVTAGAGTLGSGTVTITTPGILDLNRPDDFAFGNTFTGTGMLKKSQANTATISTAANFGGPVDLAAGTLRFTGGGTLSGAISGAGSLAVAGGTLMISGSDPNTNTGLTTVSSGTLQLSKFSANAIGGDLLLTGTGGLALLQAEQIADTATITYNKTGTNQGNVIIGNGGTETFATLNVLDGNDTGTQVQAHSGFVATGNVNLAAGAVFSIASGHIASAGGVTMTGTPVLRIAANSNSSTFSVGSGGITAAGGTIQVGQGGGTFDAVLNLDGDYTATGNVAFTDGGFTGANLREINLGASTRNFDVAAATTTTIAPDIAGTGGITKTGTGTLTLTAASASTYTGPTTVSGGSLLTTTSQVGAGDFSVGTGATLGVTLTAAGATLPATNLDADAGSTLLLATGTFGNPTVPVISATSAFTVDGPTVIRLTGVALSSVNGVPLISYGTLGGASGFGGLSIQLPTRMSGTLVDNVGALQVQLDLIAEQARWNGDISPNWDIDPNGDQATGTQNWRTTITNTPTTYFQGPPIDTDTANFNDAATGGTIVNLTTLLSPGATNVSNSELTYTFTGTGKLTGATALNKTGTGTLILANSTAYDHTGGTNINDGTLQIGDGVTPGVGLLPTAAVTNNATLVFNRPDNFSVTSAITGSGTIAKQNSNTVTYTGAANYAGPIVVNAGTLAFGAAANLTGAITNASTVQFNGAANVSGAITNTGVINSQGGGNLSGLITGSGTLNVTAGTLDITGFDNNDYTGLTTISGGTLRLNKGAGNAVGGDILITGGGILTILGTEQIIDTATITFNGTSADSTVNSTGFETIANLICNPSVATGQFQLRNGFTVTGTATLNLGVLGVSSGHTATLNAVNMSGGILRIAGNAAGSVLNVGAGGITASGGEIQVKFNVNDQDATLNLGGDFIATGNVNITDANYNGANLHIINLTGGPRTFDIAAATTTTVSPDFGDGDLVKEGDGTLALNGKLGTTGAFTLTANGGTTTINESQRIASLVIADGATVVMNQDLTPAPALGGEDPGFAAETDAVGAASSFGDPSQVSAVPEPGSLALLAFGALALFRRRAR